MHDRAHTQYAPYYGRIFTECLAHYHDRKSVSYTIVHDCIRSRCYVKIRQYRSRHPCLAVYGRERAWVFDLGIDTLSRIQQQFCCLLHTQLGHCTKVQAHIHLRTDAIPRFFKPRSIPFTYIEGVEAETQRNMAAGVLERVDTSPYRQHQSFPFEKPTTNSESVAISKLPSPSSRSEEEYYPELTTLQLYHRAKEHGSSLRKTNRVPV